MWWILLTIYILGWLGSLVFLGAVNTDEPFAFCATFIWPLILVGFLLFLLFLFFRSFYIFGQYLDTNKEESFQQYWNKEILNF